MCVSSRMPKVKLGETMGLGNIRFLLFNVSGHCAWNAKKPLDKGQTDKQNEMKKKEKNKAIFDLAKCKISIRECRTKD